MVPLLSLGRMIFIMRTLILDQNWQPVQILPWKRAFCLLYTERAQMLERYDAQARSVSNAFPIPAVLRILGKLPEHGRAARFSRLNVFTRDRGRCQYCGTKEAFTNLTLDHVIPRAQGGKSSWTNVVSACFPCNHTKADRTPEQAGFLLRTKPVRPSWAALTAIRGFLCADPHPTWTNYLRIAA